MFDFSPDIEKCLEVLKAGGIILYPTDTIWGLGCDATNEAAVEKIIAFKKRPENKSFVVLVSSEREVLQYTAAPDLAVFDYIQTFQNPVTVIYEHGLGLADNVLADDGSVAIRICKEAFCKHLLKRFRKPIVSTSANINGEPAPNAFLEINDRIKIMANHTVIYRQNEIVPAIASTIIKWQNGKAIIVRK